MAYHDVKVHQGQHYTGMRVGGRHSWRYEGTWREVKTSPAQWNLEFHGREFSYEARKSRARAAPEGSGCDVGTTFHWLILGSQFATKVDANSYDTFLTGLKWRIGAQQPGEPWSYERPGEKGAKARVVEALDGLLADVRGSPSQVSGSVVGEGLHAVRPRAVQQARLG